MSIAPPAAAEEANATPTAEQRLPAPQGPELGEMEETLQRMIWENENLQAKLKHVREVLTERAGALEANHGKVEQLEAKLADLQQALQDAVDQQASSQAQRAHCDSARAELTRRLEESQGRIGAVEQENRDLQSRQAEREQEWTHIHGDLVESMAQCRAEGGRTTEHLSAAKAQVETTENKRLQLQQELLAQQGVRAGLRQELLKIGAQRDGLSTTIQALREEIAALESEREVSGQTLAELRAERDSLQADRAVLRSRLSPVDGGAADLSSARDRAAESAADYNALAKEEPAQTPETAERSTELRKAGQELLAAQSLLALLAEARAIYTVQPNDSLSTIAGALYGTVHRWSDIYRANRHVLDDPNRIPRGTVLVIP